MRRVWKGTAEKFEINMGLWSGESILTESGGCGKRID